jgi:hypothetical protein
LIRNEKLNKIAKTRMSEILVINEYNSNTFLEYTTRVEYKINLKKKEKILNDNKSFLK